MVEILLGNFYKEEEVGNIIISAYEKSVKEVVKYLKQFWKDQGLNPDNEGIKELIEKKKLRRKIIDDILQRKKRQKLRKNLDRKRFVQDETSWKYKKNIQRFIDNSREIDDIKKTIQGKIPPDLDRKSEKETLKK